MSVQNLKYVVGWFLVVFVAAGMAVSTFHSHNTLEWHQERMEKVAETGTTISADASYCPICGYLFQTDIPSAPSAYTSLIPSDASINADELDPTCEFEVVIKGRSPPVIG